MKKRISTAIIYIGKFHNVANTFTVYQTIIYKQKSFDKK